MSRPYNWTFVFIWPPKRWVMWWHHHHFYTEMENGDQWWCFCFFVERARRTFPNTME